MSKQSVPTDTDRLTPIVEAMIFASDEPLSPRNLLRLLFQEKSPKRDERMAETGAEETDESRDVPFEPGKDAPADEGSLSAGSELDERPVEDGTSLDTPPIGQKELREIVDALNEEYVSTERPFRIVEIAGGFQFATIKEYGEFVGLLSKDKARRRLSAAALETVSIIAYRQPVSKPEIESIRGVNCDQVLLSLLERNLIAIVGRADTVGKPLLYGTTDEFLRAFGLNSLSDLPKLREIEELMEDEAYSGTSVDAISEEVTQKLLELDDEEASDEEVTDDEATVKEATDDETSDQEATVKGTLDQASSDYRRGSIELVSVESKDDESDED